MKITEFQNILQEKKIDVAIFLNTSYNKKDPSIAYFTQGLNIEFGLLAIPKNEKPALFIPGFEYERIRKKTTIKVVQPKKNLWKLLKKIFPRIKIVGVNSDIFSVNELKGLKKRFSIVKDISGEVYELRSVKTEEELKRIQESVRITEQLFEEVFSKISILKSEKKIADFLLKRTIDLECTPAFPPIVASGRNASLPHHEPEHVLNKGFLVIDYGVKKDGYCADITRTFFVGTPSQKEKELYALVLKAQENAIEKCVSGNTFEEVDTTARKILGKKSKEFIHSIGHSLGIEVHDDLPKRKKRMKMTLKEGMVMTVEPGVYKNKEARGKRKDTGRRTRDGRLDGYGIRIEDDVVVGRDGVKNLTRLTKEMRVMKR